VPVLRNRVFVHCEVLSSLSQDTRLEGARKPEKPRLEGMKSAENDLRELEVAKGK
jgi:hypothetical protein